MMNYFSSIFHEEVIFLDEKSDIERKAEQLEKERYKEISKIKDPKKQKEEYKNEREITATTYLRNSYDVDNDKLHTRKTPRTQAEKDQGAKNYIATFPNN